MVAKEMQIIFYDIEKGGRVDGNRCRYRVFSCSASWIFFPSALLHPSLMISMPLLQPFLLARKIPWGVRMLVRNRYKPRPRVFRQDISLVQLVFEETGDVFDANYTCTWARIRYIIHVYCPLTDKVISQIYVICTPRFTEFTMYNAIDANYKFLIRRLSFYRTFISYIPSDLHFTLKIRTNWI